MVREAVDMVGHHVNGIEVSIDADERLVALGDPGMVSQVLENLLVNAAHALERRPNGARIHVRAAHVGDHVRVLVTDNGPGVPEEVRSRLFEPFVTTKVIGKGSGLGLAVSMGLMRSQNGDLALVRTSDAGTEMCLQVPWTPVGPESQPSVSEAIQPPASMTLLIIDDDPDVRDVLEDFCRAYFDVVAVGSIAEGDASIARGRQPDVVLCDLMMPDGGADEWLRRCRATGSPLESRTVIITGGATTPRNEALVAANGDRVLYKPFTLAQLQAVVLRTAGRAAT